MWTDRAVRGFQSKKKRYRVSDDLGQRGAGKLVLDIRPNGIKTFFYQYYRHEDGRSKRVLINIGPYKRTGTVSGFTLSEARNKALELSKIAFEGDVKIYLEEERREKERASKQQSIAEITLLETLESYLAHKDLKPRTAYNYECSLKATFANYLDKPITKIDRERILELYQQNTKRSVARTNNAMRVFRAIYNYQRAISRMSDGTHLLPENPYDILREAKVLRKLPRRQTYIHREDMKRWFQLVQGLEDTQFTSGSTISDFLVFLLLTGTRREEARTLKREHINLRRRTFLLTDTKNRETVELPMSDYLTDMISNRIDRLQGEYIFGGLDPDKPIVSFKRPMEYFRNEHNLRFTLHDLRRTFITIAESLDISGYTIKKLVNHKLNLSNDVTAGYMIIDLDRMRVATQKISDAILNYADIEPIPKSSNVIPMRSAN